MRAVITWRQLPPLPEDPDEELFQSDTRRINDDPESYEELEQQAKDETPEGYYLYTIEYPHITATFDMDGNKTIEPIKSR